MKGENMRQRTKALAIQIMRFAETLPKAKSANVMGYQLIRCGTSVGANYRAACRAKSTADFVAKMGIVEEEADEVMYWTELIHEMGYADLKKIQGIQEEADQLVAMTVASIRTARLRK